MSEDRERYVNGLIEFAKTFQGHIAKDEKDGHESFADSKAVFVVVHWPEGWLAGIKKEFVTGTSQWVVKSDFADTELNALRSAFMAIPQKENEVIFGDPNAN